MKKLLIGFDSAWSATNSGAIAGAMVEDNGSLSLVLPARNADFQNAKESIDELRGEVDQVIIFIDQPTIVRNTSGSRPVEDIVSSIVGLRYGGMQRSATEEPIARIPMFGADAPIWDFLGRFGGAVNPFGNLDEPVLVFETYPVLYIIANNWLMQDARPSGRLPKYNPVRQKTFQLDDWKFLCNCTISKSRELDFDGLAEWFSTAHTNTSPNKKAQDQLDASICLLQAVEWFFSSNFLVIGNLDTGYITTKWTAAIEEEMTVRCVELSRKDPVFDWSCENWVHMIEKNTDDQPH